MNVKIWIKDDAGYLDWRAANPRGFVANVKKDRKSHQILLSFLKIHSAAHDLESRYDPPNWTEEGYAKVTSNNMVDLANWLRNHGFAVTKDHLCKVPCGTSFFTAEDVSDALATMVSADHNVVYPDEVPPGTTYAEGAAKTVTVNAYERSIKARNACIEHYGARCFVCAFDFGATYGSIGKGFIHVHHLYDISLIGETYKIDYVKDLRPVCPNCHSMLHTQRPAMSIEELKVIFNARTSSDT
ncbi:hypothetical protein LGN20_07325 [Burkholderia cepacia]|uniref:HNH endonuclease n=1 Tax=Burkholderia cepacia TaxID=292 RepID=UPI001CF2BB3B|nr:hypothetical protein [Burkholderia cepacia]MCA8213713.1 hypothetical protein [Burkholderia cepacia]